VVFSLICLILFIYLFFVCVFILCESFHVSLSSQSPSSCPLPAFLTHLS
jgi:hypothetical protein